MLAIISSLTFAIGNVFLFRAYKFMEASVVGLISRINIVVAAFMGIIFLREIYTLNSYLGFFLIFTGSLIIVYEKGKLVFNRGIIFALLMALFYGLAAVFDKILLSWFSAFTYAFINFLLASCGFWFVKEVRVGAKELVEKNPVLIMLGSLTAGGSFVGFLYVLQSGAVSKIFPIYDSLALVATMFLGISLLKERVKIPQKLIGVMAIIFGVFLL